MYTVIFSTRLQPIPLLVFRASDLDDTISAVYSWPNMGSLGATHNLTVESNNIAPAYFPNGGYNGGAYVRFSVNDILKTIGSMPPSVCSSRPRLLLARIFIEPGSNSGNYRNLFGYGEYLSGAYARVVDFCITAPNDEYTIHKYYRGTESGQRIVRGQWEWVGYVVDVPRDGYINIDGTNPITFAYSEYVFADPLESSRRNRSFDLDTASTPMRIGGGAFDPWNTMGTPFLMDSFYLFELMTEGQIAEAKG